MINKVVIQTEVQTLGEKVDKKLETMDEKLVTMDKKLVVMDGTMNEKLVTMDKKLVVMDGRITSVEGGITTILKRQAKIEAAGSYVTQFLLDCAEKNNQGDDD